MPEVINDIRKYNEVGIIYNDLIDFVRLYRNIELIEVSKKREMAKIMHELALMIQEEDK